MPSSGSSKSQRRRPQTQHSQDNDKQEGFAKTCNKGLAEIQSRHIHWVLICNDDAHITQDNLDLLIAEINEYTGVIAPMIISDQKIQSAGISVSSWGRVSLRKSIHKKQPQALSGACFLIPSWVRFDDGYLHGFEDIALCSFLKKRGFSLNLVSSAICDHKSGGTLPHYTEDWYALSLYGQLRFFSKSRHIPLILCMAIAQKNINMEGLKGIWKGFSMWKNHRFFTVT